MNADHYEWLVKQTWEVRRLPQWEEVRQTLRANGIDPEKVICLELCFGIGAFALSEKEAFGMELDESSQAEVFHVVNSGRGEFLVDPSDPYDLLAKVIFETGSFGDFDAYVREYDKDIDPSE
jgi:hypothetical protein